MMRKKKLPKIDEITIRYTPKINACDRPIVKTSFQAYELFSENWSEGISLLEEFNILFLDRASHVLGFSNISKGGLNATYIDVRLAFMIAIKSKSNAMILAHNHPSGQLFPSKQDISLTEKFVEAGKTLDIIILDHIILAPQGQYYSFSDEGMFL